MYRFNTEIELIMNKTQASKEIGIDRSYLSLIINGRMACSKRTAYCIVKYIDEDAEIEDYFIREEN